MSLLVSLFAPRSAPTYSSWEEDASPKHRSELVEVSQQPWASTCKWMGAVTGPGPFTAKSWISGCGPVVGILNREALLQVPDADNDATILMVIPETWDFVAPSTQEPSNEVTNPLTPTPGSTPKRFSKNPFASPTKAVATAPPTSLQAALPGGQQPAMQTLSISFGTSASALAHLCTLS